MSGRWSLLIAFAILLALGPALSLAAYVWWWVGQGHRSERKPVFRWGLWSIVGLDHRVSTSKTVAIIWTYTLAGALLAILVMRWRGEAAAYTALLNEGLRPSTRC